MSDLESFAQSYGYGALFLGTLLEGETVLILAGLMAHMGLMKLPLVILVALLGSFLITPELLYTGITNLELRLRFGWIRGGRQTEFEEKHNDYRLELRAGYYF